MHSLQAELSNICYCPLDIKLPDLDIHRLIEWDKSHETMLSNYQSMMRHNNITSTQLSFDDFKKGTGFWNHGFCINEVTYANSKTGGSIWVNEFDIHFPELVDVFNELSFGHRLRKVGFVYEDNSDKCRSSPVHIDELGFGFRIAYGCDTTSANLFVQRYLPGTYEAVANQKIKVFQDDIRGVNHTHLLDSEQIPAFYPSSATAFLLNGKNSAHGVLTNSTKNIKVTFLIMTGQQWQGLQTFTEYPQFTELLHKSMDKYRKYAIINDIDK